MSCGCGSCAGCVAAAVPSPAGRSMGGCGPMGQRLAQRLAPRVDRIRQRLTNFGLRVYTVSLVWTKWNGEERGEGFETELRRVLILPNPLVEDLTSVSLSPYAAGILPVGSVRISQISAQLTADNLMGNTIPGQAYFNGCGITNLPSQGAPGTFGMTAQQQIGHSATAASEEVPQPLSFFYEVVEDISGTPATAPPKRAKFRLFSAPFKRPGKFDWTLILERISEDRDRFGRSQAGPDLDR